MTATRDIGDFNDGDRTGAEWTSDANDSVGALWALSAGMLQGVAGTNTITGTVSVATGFTAYSDGLRGGFIAAANNTGACTLNISGVGAKGLVDRDGAALAASAIVSGRYHEFVFVAASDHFRLIS